MFLLLLWGCQEPYNWDDLAYDAKQAACEQLSTCNPNDYYLSYGVDGCIGEVRWPPGLTVDTSTADEGPCLEAIRMASCDTSPAHGDWPAVCEELGSWDFPVAG